MSLNAPRDLRTFGLVTALALAAALVGAILAVPAPARAASNVTRTLAWNGGDRLWVGVDADVRYVQGPDNKVVITGPREAVDRIDVRQGFIGYGPRGWWGWWGPWRWWDWRSSSVRIVVTAPHLESAAVSGSGRLDLGRLSQDRLDLALSGSSEVTASGAVRSLNVMVSGSGGVRLDGLKASDMRASLSGSGWVSASGACQSLRLSISGSGGADMTRLAADDVNASIFGSGSARIAPKRSADLHIAGSGSVVLAAEPARLSSQVFGSGAIIHAGKT
jgi:hypothetical protein